MNPEPTLHLRKHHHLLTKAQFDRVFRVGRRRSVRGVTVYVCPSDSPYCRMGLATSRRFGNAVARNRARRLIRESFRRLKARLTAPVDLVIRPEPGRFPDQQALVEVAMEEAVRAAQKPRTPRKRPAKE